MFTKIHYKAIAKIVKKEVDHPEGKQPQARCALTEVALNLASYFEQENPRFDRNKFITACGIE